MKTKLIIACLLLASLHCFAQKDYCKDIITNVKELSGEKEFKTPVKFNMPDVSISKTITSNGELTFIAFLVYSENSMVGQKGLFVKFEDGTILKYPDLTTSASYSIYSHKYIGALSLEITDENQKVFSSKRIVKYQIGDVEKDFPKKYQERYMVYAKCIFDKQ